MFYLGFLPPLLFPILLSVFAGPMLVKLLFGFIFFVGLLLVLLPLSLATIVLAPLAGPGLGPLAFVTGLDVPD